MGAVLSLALMAPFARPPADPRAARGGTHNLSASDRAEVERFAAIAAHFVLAGGLRIVEAWRAANEWLADYPNELPEGVTLDAGVGTVVPLTRECAECGAQRAWPSDFVYGGGHKPKTVCRVCAEPEALEQRTRACRGCGAVRLWPQDFTRVDTSRSRPGQRHAYTSRCNECAGRGPLAEATPSAASAVRRCPFCMETKPWPEGFRNAKRPKLGNVRKCTTCSGMGRSDNEIAERRAAERAPGFARRTHPEPQVGDLLGRNFRVIDVLGRGHNGRSDLRLGVECTTCGYVTEAYEYNARQGHARCLRPAAPPAPALCRCGHDAHPDGPCSYGRGTPTGGCPCDVSRPRQAAGHGGRAFKPRFGFCRAVLPKSGKLCGDRVHEEGEPLCPVHLTRHQAGIEVEIAPPGATGAWCAPAKTPANGGNHACPATHAPPSPTTRAAVEPESRAPSGIFSRLGGCLARFSSGRACGDELVATSAVFCALHHNRSLAERVPMVGGDE
jgi:hypothetical protein